jgi:hypothetical protein
MNDNKSYNKFRTPINMPAPAVQGCVEIGLFPLLSSPLQIAVINLLEQTFYHFNTTDAAKAGMGGVYFDASGQGYVWRFPFPDNIQSQLVSKANPSGRVTNSDLEQAGLFGQVSVISHHHDVAYATLANGLDNTPAVARITKGAVTSDGPVAAHLCNYTCAHQRQHRYCHVPHFLPGDPNVMADDALRLQHLTNSTFLAHFQQEYPQPKPWQLLQLPRESASQLISALRSVSPLLADEH